MGLLDAFSAGPGGLLGSGWDDPKTIGILSAAAGLMQAGGPSRMPVSLGQALSQGLTAGMQGYQGATQARRRDEMYDMQLKQARQAQADAEMARDNEAKFRASIPNPQMASEVDHAVTPPAFGSGLPTSGMYGAGASPTGEGFGFDVPRLTAPERVDPRHQQLWQAMNLGQIKPMEYLSAITKDDATVKLADGENLYRKKGSGYELVASGRPKASDQPAAVREYEYAKGQGYGGTFEQFQLDQRKAGATNVAYGAPMPGVDANGRSVFFQPGRDGSPPIIVPGVQPTPPAMPESTRTKIAENNVVLEKIRKAQAATTDKPNSFGMQNVLGDTIMQRWDPDGTEARAFVADIAGQKIHDRSGAAVSVGESERLKPYIPNATDRADTVQKKLKAFEAEYSAMQRELQSGASVGQVSAAKAEASVRVRKYNKETGKLE